MNPAENQQSMSTNSPPEQSQKPKECNGMGSSRKYKRPVEQKLQNKFVDAPMPSLVVILLIHLFGMNDRAYADAEKDSIINSFVGEYDLTSECDLYYYGIGRPPDFEKAIECYGYDPVLEILSHANGHGVKRNLNRAKELARNLIERGHHLSFEYSIDNLLRDLENLKSDTIKREIDRCDYAYSTPVLIYCTKLDRLREKLKLLEFSLDYRDHENERIRESWVNLDAAMRRFASASGDWGYFEMGSGSLRSIYSGRVEIEIFQDHRVFVGRSTNYTPDENITAEDFQKADQQLNEVYNQRECCGELVLADQNNDQLYSLCVEASNMWVLAQREWIRYRDAMVEFSQAFHKGRHPPDKVAIDIMTWLTRERMLHFHELVGQW